MMEKQGYTLTQTENSFQGDEWESYVPKEKSQPPPLKSFPYHRSAISEKTGLNKQIPCLDAQRVKLGRYFNMHPTTMGSESISSHCADS